MDIFFLLLGKILPLYLIIGAGYFAGQKLKVQRESIASILIYLLVPVVFFGATAQMKLQHEYLALPFVFFILAGGLGFGLYKLSCLIWKDGRRNLVGYMMGTANQGYFGIPIFLALFGEQYLGLYVFIALGYTFYESTIGYYLMARGNYTVRDSLIKLARLPTIPAVVLGLCCSGAGVQWSQTALDFYAIFKGAYAVLGMMLIGLGLSSMKHLRSDIKFTGFVFLSRFVAWPVTTLAVLYIYSLMAPVEPVVREIFIMLSLMPVAANTVAFATHLRVEPDKASTVVMLTTAFALIYIPLMLKLLVF